MLAFLSGARSALIGLVLGLVAPVAAPAQDRMALHLVLAFDVSASVNDVEFALQRDGTATALRAPGVAAAIDHAPGGVAIAIVQWSSATRQALGLDWVLLHHAQDVIRYADKVAAMPRRLPGGGTMIHTGLDYAARLLEAAPGHARRQVIDLSGNGRSDDLDLMLRTRDRLARTGVVINALAVEEHGDNLTAYFRQHLISGPNAFVITANGFEDFADAMHTKLLREISGSLYASAREK